jgi:hypothetical protein
MEGSQNKYMLETVDESCFFFNTETKYLTNQYLYFYISVVAVMNIKLICEYRIHNYAIFIVLTMMFFSGHAVLALISI